ncbi:hypothetical protein PHYBLDRAFT_68870 [Phycomyces blakesleeanus NRRL 1555(-)]|uniref:DDE Tnp4 domain-containing protein n=1 Tax=Phycomyces blakesleeanus (strain ATCC 8743b / DSM 1359 / FGSC 10004 / NBRC 33097 / NRRL 1555) TaxID=763407 RepID=A0A162TMI3_PHYB8|nr:hypothetical protein PHYBLDRAFT_68870 [Phycomyces blakesleeanus NRRL 1555(-)]OAD68323.1 hypothetical protein PHYBLDRAFT_68870 [Phycomyces blakesleeanus NRRL 1555(-)]|eukprot:XP_018286363.1 hypothetical protein PHYBLDRAFT_68870 [Phycomyces blakesleeanus NRRL 1555(-)]
MGKVDTYRNHMGNVMKEFGMYCKRFAETIYKKNNVYNRIIGFVDGTMQKIARPNVNNEQRLAYNGWKHIHCLKYQTIVTPDGISSSFIGPFPGSTHDVKIFDDSKTLERLIF